MFKYFILVAFAFHAIPLYAAFTSHTVVFHSTALDRETTYIALIQDESLPASPAPTLYLLHGATGSYLDWTSNTRLLQLAEHLSYNIIMPDGGEFGWYLDSDLKPENRYASLIAHDLIADVERRFPAGKNREARSTAGLSMGGHGAITLAAKFPRLFGAASSLSGILDLTPHPNSWRIKELLGPQKDNAALWHHHSAVGLADALGSASVALMFDCGTSDSTEALWDNRAFHERLTNRGIPHVYREHPGNHNWTYWDAHLPEHLDFHQRYFAGEAGSVIPGFQMK